MQFFTRTRPFVAPPRSIPALVCVIEVSMRLPPPQPQSPEKDRFRDFFASRQCGVLSSSARVIKKYFAPFGYSLAIQKEGCVETQKGRVPSTLLPPFSLKKNITTPQLLDQFQDHEIYKHNWIQDI